jgi:hypothetical protein
MIFVFVTPGYQIEVLKRSLYPIIVLYMMAIETCCSSGPMQLGPIRLILIIEHANGEYNLLA